MVVFCRWLISLEDRYCGFIFDSNKSYVPIGLLLVSTIDIVTMDFCALIIMSKQNINVLIHIWLAIYLWPIA